MTARSGAAARASHGRRGCLVTVCRGCCCGTERKHPESDHDGLLAALAEVGAVRVSDCLDVCGDSNVVVVQPSADGRRRRGRPVWLGLVNDAGSVADIRAWIAAGGPGIAPMPGPLALNVIRPPRSR